MAAATEVRQEVPLTDTQREHANRLLSYLDAHVEHNWQALMREHLDESEYGAVAAHIDAALRTYDERTLPVGAYIGGTGKAKEGAGIDGEDAQIAVQVLKDAHRLVQAGRGRGKLLILIDNEPLSTTQTRVVRPTRVVGAATGRGPGRPRKATTATAVSAATNVSADHALAELRTLLDSVLARVDELETQVRSLAN